MPPTVTFEALQATFTGALFDPTTPEKARQIVERAVAASGLLLWNEVRRRTPRFNSDLWNSITLYRPRAAHGVIEGIVGTPRPHALPIEYGRTPGAKGPPIGPILLWVRRKGLARKGSPTLQRISRRSLESQERSIAYVIARSIHLYGFAPPHEKGWRMFEKGFEAVRPQIDRILQAAATDVANAYGAN